MTKLFLLVLAALVLASVSPVGAAGLAKHHHGKKFAGHASGKHHKGHHAKAHRHLRA